MNLVIRRLLVMAYLISEFNAGISPEEVPILS